MQDQRLMDYFKFDETDLQANRGGAFSEAQRQRISSNQASSYQGYAWMAGCATPVGLGLCGWMFYLILFSHNAASLAGLWINLGIWGGIALLVGILSFRAMLTKHQFRLASVRGTVNIVREVVHGEHGHTSVYHELHIGGKEFSVDEGLADVMMQGDEYIIYYDLDNAETGGILSAELVSKAS